MEAEEECKPEAESARKRHEEVRLTRDTMTEVNRYKRPSGTEEDANIASPGYGQVGKHERERTNDAASQSVFTMINVEQECVDAEELKTMRAKFARMSTVLGNICLFWVHVRECIMYTHTFIQYTMLRIA